MKNTKKYVITLISISILVLPITWYWFTSNGKIPIGIELEKSDWLIFWGSFIGFIGTITISSIILWQNKQLHEINKKLVEQNAISNSFSEIKPIEIEIQKLITNIPLGRERQILNRKEETNQQYFDLWFFRLFFKSTRQFRPNLFRINSISLGIVDSDNEHIEKIAGFCSKGEKDQFFIFGSETTDDCCIMPVFIIKEEGDDLFWDEIINSKKLSIHINFWYANPFNVITNSNIRMILIKKDDRIEEMRNFLVRKNYIYSCEYSYSQK